MKEYDYAAAIKYVETHGLIGGNHGSVEDDEIFDGVQATIRHALRFAEKMMQEPSEGMIEMGYKADLNSEAEEPKHLFTDVFKAMRDAALKELGE